MAENKEQRKSDLPENEENAETRRIDLSDALAADAPANEPAAEAAETAPGAPEGDAPEVAAAQPADGEEEYSAAEGTDARLLSEFAPKPINIPNVDLEKEKKRQEKRQQNRDKEAKKVEARKNKSKNGRKKSAGRKFVVAVAGFLLFALLAAAMAGFISVLSVQIATSEYAFDLAVKNSDLSELSLGGIENPEILGLERSSRSAALVDIIRDNSDVVVTYREINSSIRGSGLDEFVSKRLKSAADYLLKGKNYEDLTGAEIAAFIKNNATLVYNLTGRMLTDEDYATIENYFEEYGNLGAVSRRALDETRLSQHTGTARHLMSLYILGALLLVCIILIILMCIVCRESTYLPMGWSFILGGLSVILAAIFFRPSYSVVSDFLQSVLNGYFRFFATTVIIIAGVFTVVGALIFLIGNASADRDD